MEGLWRTSMQRTANCAPSCSYTPLAQAHRHSRAGAHAAPCRALPRLKEQRQVPLHSLCDGGAALLQLPQHRRRGLQVWLLLIACEHCFLRIEKGQTSCKGDKHVVPSTLRETANAEPPRSRGTEFLLSQRNTPFTKFSCPHRWGVIQDCEAVLVGAAGLLVVQRPGALGLLTQ